MSAEIADVKSEEQSEPKSEKSTLFFFIAGCVLAIILAVIFFWPESGPVEPPFVEYNYFKFYNISGTWQSDIQLDGRIYRGDFRFNPYQVENVSISGNLSPEFNMPPVYIAFDPLSENETFKYQALASSDLAFHLVRALNISVEGACTRNATEVCVNRTIVNCDTPNASVIVLDPAGEAEIVLEDRCVTLKGSEFDLVRSVDRLLFQWYKVMS